MITECTTDRVQAAHPVHSALLHAPYLAVAFAHALEVRLIPIVEALNQELHQFGNSLEPAVQLIYQYQIEAMFVGLTGTFAGIYGRTFVSKVETARVQLVTALNGGGFGFAGI